MVAAASFHSMYFAKLSKALCEVLLGPRGVFIYSLYVKQLLPVSVKAGLSL